MLPLSPTRNIGMPTPWPSRYALKAPGQSPETARFTRSVWLPTVTTSPSSA